MRVRDRWTGWSLGQKLRRLSADMQAAHGHGGVLLAETFPDPSRFEGSCYRAANWRLLGLTNGSRRRSSPKTEWGHHGLPKQVLVYPLQRNARALLGQPGQPPQWQGPPKGPPAHTWRVTAA